jgi:hypothetical protein
MFKEDWCHYFDLEPIRRLRNEGRELLGKTVTLTEKRDGENVSAWLDKNGGVCISSHNQCQASQDIINRFKETNEYHKVKLLLKSEIEYHKEYVLYGELLKEVGPTRIEPKRKKIQWVLFDAWDRTENRYISYTQLYQLAYHYKLPLVRAVDFFVPCSMEELNAKITLMMKWCRKHRREGIVGKDYDNQIFFKEKIDLPKLPKIPRDPQVQLPPMTQEKIIRALQHAFDEVGEANWKDTKIAMPIVAKHFSIEAKEHNFATPRNMYQLWIETPIEQLKAVTSSQSKGEQ